jgi:hypothetical protein
MTTLTDLLQFEKLSCWRRGTYEGTKRLWHYICRLERD